jgi:hypothetical protein
MSVIGLSLLVMRYLWSFSRSRQSLPGHGHFCLGKFLTNPLPLPTWRHGRSSRYRRAERPWIIPVVVCTASAQPHKHNIDVCYQLGVHSYRMKPMDFERLRYALGLLMRYWFSVITPPERRSL